MMEPGRELDARISVELYGRRLFTYDEMLEEAVKVWEEQPNCEVFHMGFRCVGRDASNYPILEQSFLSYSTAPEYAEMVKDRLRTHYQYYVTVGDSAAFPPSVMPLESDSFICIIGVHEHLIARAQGITEEHAVCLAALKVAELTP